MLHGRTLVLILCSCLLAAHTAGAQVGVGSEPAPLEGTWHHGEPDLALEPRRVFAVCFINPTDPAGRHLLARLAPLAREQAAELSIVVVTPDETGAVKSILTALGDGENVRVVTQDKARRPITRAWFGDETDADRSRIAVVDHEHLVSSIADGDEGVVGIRSALDVLDAIPTPEEQQQIAVEQAAMRAELDRGPLRFQLMGDFVSAAAAIDPLMEKFPRCRTLLLLEKFRCLIIAEKFEQAYVVADDAAKSAWHDANTLNELAWFVVDDQDVGQRDLDRAMRYSERSNELSKYRNGAFLDTLARVHFEEGELEEAITWQTRAVAAARTNEEIEVLEPVLQRYKDALPR